MAGARARDGRLRARPRARARGASSSASRSPRFQLVQDKLSRMLAEVTTMQLLCWRASVLAGEGRLTDGMASLAKLNNAAKARAGRRRARHPRRRRHPARDHVARHFADWRRSSPSRGPTPSSRSSSAARSPASRRSPPAASRPRTSRRVTRMRLATLNAGRRRGDWMPAAAARAAGSPSWTPDLVTLQETIVTDGVRPGARHPREATTVSRRIATTGRASRRRPRPVGGRSRSTCSSPPDRRLRRHLPDHRDPRAGAVGRSRWPIPARLAARPRAERQLQAVAPPAA